MPPQKEFLDGTSRRNWLDPRTNIQDHEKKVFKTSIKTIKLGLINTILPIIQEGLSLPTDINQISWYDLERVFSLPESDQEIEFKNDMLAARASGKYGLMEYLFGKGVNLDVLEAITYGLNEEFCAEDWEKIFGNKAIAKYLNPIKTRIGLITESKQVSIIDLGNELTRQVLNKSEDGLGHTFKQRGNIGFDQKENLAVLVDTEKLISDIEKYKIDPDKVIELMEEVSNRVKTGAIKLINN